MAFLPKTASITSLSSSVSNLLLATPNSLVGYNPQSPNTGNGEPPTLRPALLFNYEGEQSSQFNSDITDHFVEDNTSIQDQIALPPIEIQTAGYIGDLNDVIPGLLAPLKFVSNKLTTVAAYVPGLSTTANNALAQAQLIYSTAAKAADTAVAAWSSIAGSGGGGDAVIGSNGLVTTTAPQSKQQQLFQQFYFYYASRTLFTVQTPWCVFENMAIKSFKAVQSEDTRVVSTFEVTFKQMRFATTQTVTAVNLNSSFMQNRAADQGAPKVNNGTSPGLPVIATPGDYIRKILG